MLVQNCWKIDSNAYHPIPPFPPVTTGTTGNHSCSLMKSKQSADAQSSSLSDAQLSSSSQVDFQDLPFVTLQNYNSTSTIAQSIILTMEKEVDLKEEVFFIVWSKLTISQIWGCCIDKAKNRMFFGLREILTAWDFKKNAVKEIKESESDQQIEVSRTWPAIEQRWLELWLRQWNLQRINETVLECQIQNGSRTPSVWQNSRVCLVIMSKSWEKMTTCLVFFQY